MKGYGVKNIGRREVLTGVCGVTSTSLAGCLGSVLSPDEGEFVGPHAEEPTLRWSTTFPHIVHSPVATNNDTVFAAHGGSITGISTSSGNRRWRTKVDSPVNPLIHDDTVYVRITYKAVSALDAQSGAERWRTNTDADINYGPTVQGEQLYVTGAPSGSSPDADIIHLTEEPQLHGVDLPQAAVSPVLPAGGDVVLTTASAPRHSHGNYRNGHVRKFDPSLTTERWAVPVDRVPNPTVATEPAEVLVGGKVDELTAVSLDSGEVNWRTPVDARLTRPTADRSRVYVGTHDGRLRAFDRGDGTERWQYEPDTALLGSLGAMSTPVRVGDLLVAGNENGVLYAVDAAEGTLRWSFHTDGDLQTPPAVQDGSLYLPAGDTLYAIDI
jgi:outer membrane protein assembly factor BamB